ncbi:MAG: saccharopine dehydrogenase NADP-binding domain-containing protein [Parcubacteria group bacterium]|nr:saccharopine dehydrogenase NADP-binding domain-containing protein [Parcubacteria group bacterium]
MKVFIVGGGATGWVIAHFLSQAKEIEAISCGDINVKKAKRFLPANPKITLQTLDAAQKDKVANAIKGYDLLINASLPKLNKILLEACLEAGVNYQDLASEWNETKIEQLDYDGKFKEKNLTGLINASASPGVTNLAAKILAAKLDRVDAVRVRLLENVSSDIPFTAWSKETTFDEATYQPYVWDRGKFVKKDNFADEELFNFPEPFTNRKCYLIAQEEVGTLPLYIKTRYTDLKAAGSEIEFVHTLYKLGLLKKHLVRIGNALVSPYEFMVKAWPDVPTPEEMKKIAASGKLRDAHFWATVLVSGSVNVEKREAEKPERKKKEFRADILFPAQSEVSKLLPGANYISYAAGLTAAAFARDIPAMAQKGIYPPEAIDTEECSALAEKFKKAGVKIEIAEVEK